MRLWVDKDKARHDKTRQDKQTPNGSFVFDRSILDRYYFPSKYLYFLVTYSVQIYTYNERMGKKAKKLGQKLPFLLLYVIHRFHKLLTRFKSNRLSQKDVGFKEL
jgi:hypothetical protein